MIERMGQPATDLATDWWLAAALGVLDDHVYFGLLGVDRTYQELFVGPNLDRLLGGPAQVPGLWRSRIDPRDRPAYYAVEAELLAGRPAQVDYRVHGLDGVTRWIRARVNPEALADGSVRFAGILSDITRNGRPTTTCVPRSQTWPRRTRSSMPPTRGPSSSPRPIR